MAQDIVYPKVKAMELEIMGKEKISEEEFSQIILRRSLDLESKDEALDGIFEICLERNTRESLQTVKDIGEKILSEQKMKKYEKEKIKRYIALSKQ